MTVTEDTLTAELSDGRTISVPLAWYPRLVHATADERGNWRLIGGGEDVLRGKAVESHVHIARVSPGTNGSVNTRQGKSGLWQMHK